MATAGDRKYQQWKEDEANKRKANLAEEGKQATLLIQDLNYSSSPEDFSAAIEELNDWHTQSKDLYKYDKNQRLVNETLYETNMQLIAKNRADATNYSNLLTDIVGLEDELNGLRLREDGEGLYDFTEMNKVLDDYKKTGTNILEYNANWVDKKEYDKNISAIAQYITMGKSFESMDIDAETPGIQMEEGMAEQEDFMNAALNYWQLNMPVAANDAIRQSVAWIDNKKRLEIERKQQIIDDENEFITGGYTAGLSPEKVNLIEIYSQDIINSANAGEAKPPPVPEGLGEKDVRIAQELAMENTLYTDNFNLRKEAIAEEQVFNLEAGAFGVINAFRQKMGKGEGFKGVSADPALMKLLTDIGAYSTAKGTLTSADNRKAIAVGIGENIETIFDYLEGAGWWAKDYYEEGSEIRDLLDGKYAEGSPEWYANMDRILDSYYPKNDRGIREENKNAKKRTVGEFGGNNELFGVSSMEINGFEILMSAIKAYDAIRKLDIEFGKDPSNPDNLDL